MKYLKILAVFLLLGLVFLVILAKFEKPVPPEVPALPRPLESGQVESMQIVSNWVMKLVNETVTDKDLDAIKDLGIGILSGEWGMDDANVSEVLSLLDRIHARGMKFIINFSDGSAWGYREDGTDSMFKRPSWQKQKVQRYLRKIAGHPGIYGYDISNEAGENLPNGDRYRITLKQLRQAAKDVRAVDPNRPLIIRMHYWDEEDGDFTKQNPFAEGIADVVMLNLYSNYSEDRIHPLLPNMVEDSGQTLVDKIQAVDRDVRVWIFLAAFQELPWFVRPQASDLERDLESALGIQNIENLGFFGWGPERYPEEPPGWYLPRDGKDLLEVIVNYTK